MDIAREDLLLWEQQQNDDKVGVVEEKWLVSIAKP